MYVKPVKPQINLLKKNNNFLKASVKPEMFTFTSNSLTIKSTSQKVIKVII